MMAVFLYKYMITCFLPMIELLKPKVTVCIGLFHFVQILLK